MMVATLTPMTTFAPVPRVEIALAELGSIDGGSPSSAGPDTLTGGTAGATGDTLDAGSAAMTIVSLPEGTDSVTLWRRHGGRSFKVRGVVGRSFSGTLGALDMEAPFGVPASYELECLAGGDPISRVPLGSTVLPRMEGPSWLTLIQQPLNPGLHAVVEDHRANAPDIQRHAEGESVLTEGSIYPTVIGFGPRRGLEEVELLLAADDRDTAAQLWGTLGSEESPQLQAWLIRSNHPLLPPVFFCRVGPLREAGVDLDIGGTRSRFSASVTEIAPPAPALIVPSLRYSDLAAALGGTYTGIAAVLPRYSEWATAWEYSGAAG